MTAYRTKLPSVPGQQHQESFTSRLSLVVNHNFGRSPSGVIVRNVGGQEIDAAVLHLNDNQVQLDFDIETSGMVIVS